MRRRFRPHSPLGYKPFNYIIGSPGKAYVTRHTVSERGFTMSVVDIDRGELLGGIGDIHRGARLL